MLSSTARGLLVASIVWSIELTSPLANAADFHLQLGHQSSVHALAYSPDGRYLASASDDQTVRIWQLSTGKELRTLAGHRGRVTSVAFAADGLSVVTGSFDSTVRLWDVRTGKEIAKLVGHKTHVNAVAMSRDGTRVASAGADSVIKIWDVPTGKELATLAGHELATLCLAFSPDDRFLASGGRDNMLRLWDLATSQPVRTISHTGYVSSLAYSTDGTMLVSGSWAGPVSVWKVPSGELVARFVGHTDHVEAVAFSASGKEIASGGWDNTVRVWSLSTKQQIRAHPHPAMVNALAFSRDQKWLATGSDSSVRLFEVDTGKEAAPLPGRTGIILQAAFRPDGQVVASVDMADSLNWWDIATGKQIRSTHLPTGYAIALAFSPDGKQLVTAGRDGQIRIWDSATGKAATSFAGAGGWVWSLAFSPDGREIAAGFFRGLTSYDSNGKVVHDYVGHSDYVYGIAYSPDGRFLASASRDKTVKIWDRASAQCVFTLTGHSDGVTDVAYSADGSMVASGGRDKTVKLWNAATGALLRTLEGHTSEVRTVAFSKDGRQLISGGWDKTARIWDVASGSELTKLAQHDGFVESVAESPDAKYFMTAGYEGAVRLWRKDDPAQWMAMVSSKGGEWLLLGDSGYFDASLHGGDLVGIVEGMNAFNIDQLALKNNRPDLVLERMGLGSAELKQYYRQRYLNRLSRAKISEAELSTTIDLPIALVSVDNTVSKAPNTNLALTFKDSKALKSYQVYVNGVPTEKGQGKPLSGREAKVALSIDLTPGTNLVEVSALNTRGQESLRALTVLEGPNSLSRQLFFVGFGVSNYRDPKIPDLSFAHQDAQQLGAAFGKLKGYDKVTVKTYVEAAATRDSIRAAHQLLAQSKPQDTVVVFIAGHGLHEETREAKYYFLTHDAKLSDLAHTAASFEDIEGLLSDIPARQKLFLMDTCESGERDEGVASAALRAAEGLKLGARGIRAKSGSASASISGPRPWLLDRDRYIFQDLSRRSGAMVFSSSRGNELSYESSAIANGLFSHAILSGLTGLNADADKDGSVTDAELRTFVSARVADMSGELQHPTVDRDNAALRLIFKP